MRKLMRQFESSLYLSEIEPEIQLVLEAIIDTYKPTRVILFGSATTNSFFEESDFDFLIILKTQDDVKQAWKKLKEVRPSSKRPIDVIFRTEADFIAGFKGGASLIAQESGRILYSEVPSDSNAPTS